MAKIQSVEFINFVCIRFSLCMKYQKYNSTIQCVKSTHSKYMILLPRFGFLQLYKSAIIFSKFFIGISLFRE